MFGSLGVQVGGPRISNMSTQKTDPCAGAAVAISTAVSVHCQKESCQKESKLAPGLAMPYW